MKGDLGSRWPSWPWSSDDNMKRFEAVVFDLGGPLIEYDGEHAIWPDLEAPGLQAAHDYLQKQGISVPDLEQFSLAGFDLLPRRWQMATSGERNLTVPVFLADILDNLGVTVPGESMLEAAASRYEAAVCAGATPIPHSREVVAQLKSEGYKLGLISNTMFSGKAHLADLEKFDLSGYFDAELFSSDVNEWKPNRAPFRRILNELNVAPEKAVFIGDDPGADVLGGRRAGMYVVHFESSDRFPSPDGARPDATIYSLPELIRLLKQLNGAN